MFFNKRDNKAVDQEITGDFVMSNEQAVEQFGDTVYRIALKMTKHEADAQDIFQEVFMRFIRYEIKPESESHAKHWFIRATINCCKSFFEKQKKQLAMVEIEPELITEERLPDYSNVQTAVDTLDERYRIVIYLFYYENYKIKEISEILNESAGTIKSKLNRARALLKDLIQEEQRK